MTSSNVQVQNTTKKWSCGRYSVELLCYCCVMFSAVGFVWLFMTVCEQSLGTFTGHRVVRITPSNADQVNILDDYLSKNNYDVWRKPSCVQCSVDIRVSPNEFDDVTSVLTLYGIEVETLIDDLEASVRGERRSSRVGARPGEKEVDLFDYTRYHPIEEIYSWVHNITTVYEDITSVINIATSSEGRPLLGIKISTTTTEDKPVFYFQGGIHAREWISPATVMYMVGQMLDNYKKDDDVTDVVDMFDWYILPVTNPDGYAYTWTPGEDNRFWRKTRSVLEGTDCLGVDPNRNWGVNWAGDGSEHEPCFNLYHGPYVFSEPETRGVSDFLSSLDNLRVFIDFHSYGQMVLTPWGYTEDLPVDYGEQFEAARKAVAALHAVHGTNYTFGNHANTIYKASGVTIDWVYKVLGVKFSYIIELRDKVGHGFVLPENHIIPTGEETFEALKALAKHVHKTLNN